MNEIDLKIVSKDFEMAQLFGHDNKPFQRLGQGLHKDVFYYAVNSQLDSEGRNLTIVITSDRKFYSSKEKDNEIKKHFDLNYLNDFDGAAIDHQWDNNSILDFLQKKEKEISINNLVKKMTELNEKHIGHGDKRIHSLIACFIPATYCFSLFDYMPRINIFALTDCGKSRQSKILDLLSFNAMWFSKATDSAQFRSVESTCGTPIVDNFDKLPKESKQAVFHFMEVGFDREGTYRLSEGAGRGKWKTKKFDIYCPFVINSTRPFESDAVQNRCILIRMENYGENFPKPNTKNKEWAVIRNALRIWALKNWKEIKANYELLENQLNNLIGRDQDIWLPILTIAKMVNKKTFNEMIALAKDKIEESKTIDEQEEIYKLICELVLERLGKQKFVSVDLSSFADEILCVENDLNMEEDKKLVKEKHRLYLKILKNFFMASPTIWKKERIKTPQNRMVLEVHKRDLANLIKARNYIELQKKYFDLTYFNQPNLTNSSNSLNQPNQNRLTQVKKVSKKQDKGKCEKNA